ncbi:MAG: DUF1553 domain-containing protein [Planctomycetota bacterium]|nr:DUF1553 domain-containing protein [Planctomycetota bacterium]MDA1212765.1 DUF1553 domain-containing protein [Planctomycetota bacterium]
MLEFFRTFSVLIFSLPLFSSVVQADENQATVTEAHITFFEEHVRPLLVNNCYNCHSATTNSRGGLRVDDRNGLLTGGDHGPAVVPGDAENSLLMQAVRQIHDKVKMPPKKKLTDEEIAVLEQWIQDGAAWPQLEIPAALGEPADWYDDFRQSHWAFQPFDSPPVPNVKETTWPRDGVDRFILAELEANGLTPVGDADALTFIRRVTFDLTGLPPTIEEIDHFISRIAELQEGNNGELPQTAIEELVDRLLASPAFGERWGRHWLDVARYGESTGSGRNMPYPHAWRYRDYVINAFNNDKPYDRFIREQIAGDLLSAGTQAERDEQLIATGFLALGVRDVNQRFKVRFVMDNIDEQIDTVSRAVLGLTVSCARCHDHKFEPIPTTDYYALAGIFYSTDLCTSLRNKMGGGGMDYYDTDMLLLLGPAQSTEVTMAEKIAEAKTRLDEAIAELAALQENKEEAVSESEGDAEPADRKDQLAEARKKIKKMENQLDEQRDPAVHGPVALGVRDGSNVRDTEIRIRGEAEKLGPVVPRGFLTTIEVPNAPTISPGQSGRLELAEWLTSRDNPLTPRVMTNRVWHYLFGRGLVPSVDNFGITGDRRSHPELLDHLSQRFIDDGWSVKTLIRNIVLSRAYRLSADTDATNAAIDPGNRLIWKHTPRRLEAEEIRDAMLAVGGNLDRMPLHGSPAMELKVRELNNKSAEAKKIGEFAEQSVQRSVYLPLLRGLLPRSLEVFDFAEQGMVTGRRDATTVATQALYLLNDPFVQQQAAALTTRLTSRTDLDDVGRIDLAYRWAFARTATETETTRGTMYLTEYAALPGQDEKAAWTSFCQALLASAEFRYIK